jgi:hypothetical protein
MSRTIEQLVDQQVLRWLAERRIADRTSWRPESNDVAAQEAHRPVICISRECGALGAETGRFVAENLGFSFYSQELVDQIAKQAHVRRKVVESLDERRRGALSRWIDELVLLGRFTPSDYMRNLSEVVLTLGRHGQSVIVGRGAFLILAKRWSLRVRCHAPLEWRIARMAERHKLTEAEARAMVLRTDGERVDFYRENFDIDIRDPQHFDVILNSAQTTAEQRVDIIVAAFESRFGAPQSQRRPAEGEHARVSAGP